eukprot:sb/3464027/
MRPKSSSSDHPDHDPSDPFRFVSNGHTSPEKTEPVDCFAFHSPEHQPSYPELKQEMEEAPDRPEPTPPAATTPELTTPPPLALRMALPEDDVKQESEPSKLHRGKLSFFKQAISQEVNTMVESERIAKEKEVEIPEPPPPVRSPPKEVVRKVVKRPQPYPNQPPLPVHGDKTKVIHSISASPIPLHSSGGKHFLNGHKVNVVKIEKHHHHHHHPAPPTTSSTGGGGSSGGGPPNLTSVFHKDLSVFKFSEHTEPAESRRKRKSSEQDSRGKKVLKDHLLKDQDAKKLGVVRVKTEPAFSGPSAVTPAKTCEKKKVLVKKTNSSSLKSPGLKSPVRATTPLKSPLRSPIKSPPPPSPVAAAPIVMSPVKMLKTLNMPDNDEEDDVPMKVKRKEKERQRQKTEPKKEPKVVVKTHAIPTPPSSLLVDPKNFLKIEPCPDGSATVVRLDMADFEKMSLSQQNLVVDYFFEITFGETDGVADHVMGVISNGAREMPNVLSYMLRMPPG